MANPLQNTLLAILFAAGDPVEPERMAQALSLDVAAVREQLESLGEEMARGDGPFALACLEGRYQMVTKLRHAQVIRQVLELRRDTPLSQAALEVLAIIAYNQPVTRAFIEQVRGVDSSSAVSSLVERSLVEEAGRLELPGRPISYRTTENFLRCFGLRCLEELPPVSSEGEVEEQLSL